MAGKCINNIGYYNCCIKYEGQFNDETKPIIGEDL